MAFSYYRSVTLDESKCGTADSTDFPVTFTGTYSYLATVANGGLVQNANGYDIGFYSDSALTTKLDWEMVTYTAATGFLEAHFRVGTLSASTNGVVYLAYGDSGISTFQGNVSGTWNSAYKLVYHFKDGATLDLTDSTANNNDGTAVNTPTATTGQVDGGMATVGASSQYATTPLTSTATDFTCSLWIKPTTGMGAYNRIIDARYDTGFYLARHGSNTDIGGGVKNTADPYGIYLTFPYDAWSMIHTIRSGITHYLYKDGGASSTSVSCLNTALGGTALNLAREYSGGNYYTGSMDELRFSDVARSTSWITAEYNNQSSPSSFYTMGSQVAVGGYTLTASGSTFTLTGTAANLEFGRTLAAGSGTFAVTGTDANLEFGRKVAAASGTYALTGTAANLEFGRKVAAGSGSYTLTGTAANLEFGRYILAGSGTFAVTGTAATLIYGQPGSYTLAANGTSYAVTGTDATLTCGRLLTAAGATYTLTGTAASLEFGRLLSAGSGTYVLTGTDAALRYSAATATVFAVLCESAPRYSVTRESGPLYAVTRQSGSRYDITREA